MADTFDGYDGYEDEDEAPLEEAVNVASPDREADVEPVATAGYTSPVDRSNALSSATNYIAALEKSKKTNAEIMQEAQRVLLQRANEGMDAGGWFKIAAAFGKPTKTGSFGETLGNVNEVLGSEADKKLKAKRDLEEMQMKYKMQLGAQDSDLAKARMDTYIRTAGIKQPPVSPIRQMQIEASQLPKNSPERLAIEQRIARLTAPKVVDESKADNVVSKRYALGVLEKNRKNPGSVTPEELSDARIILGLKKPEGSENKGKTNFNIKQSAYEVIQKYNENPESVTPEELSDARKILGLDKDSKETKPPSARDTGTLYTDKHLVRAAQEIFGNALVPESKENREKVEAKAAQYRTAEKDQRIQEKRESRPPPREKPAKEPALNIDDIPVVAQQLGVPANTRPYEGVNDKTVQSLLLNNTKKGQSYLSKMESLTSNTFATDADVKRFLALNAKNKTGPTYAYVPNVALGTDYQTMQSIASKLAPENRKEGTGSVSDFDAKQLLKMTLSIEKGYQTNKDVGTALLAYNQALRDKAKFVSDYFQANRHIDGADAAWLSYMKDNPIFDPRQPDRLVINRNRKTYRQFFYPAEGRARGGMVGYANGGVVNTVNNYQGYGDLAALRQKYAHGGVVKMQEGGDTTNPFQEDLRRRRQEIEDAQKPLPPASDTVNRARAIFGQGLAASWGDEAEALYRRYLTKDGERRSFDNILSDIQADYRRFSEENPVQSLSTEFVGGLAPSIAAMVLPGGQAVTAANASRMARLAPALTKTPLRRSATAGFGSGAISGFGAGEGSFGDRLLESGKSALIGGTLGPLIGKGGQLLYGGGKGIYKRLLKPGTDRIEEAALQKVLKKMADDGLTPQQAIRQVALERGYNPSPNPIGTRPRTKLRDVSPGLTDLAETVAQRPGAGRKAMIEDTVKTGRGTKGRTMDIVSENMGKGKTMFQTETDLTDALKGNAKSLYDDAYKFGTVKDQRILAMMDQPQFKEAYRQVMETNKIRKANAIAKGEDPSQYDMKQVYKITETQPGIYQMDLVDAPDVKTLDQIKRGLDYIIRSGRKSSNAADQDAAHALNEYKNTFLGILDETVPAYKTARQTYKGDLEVLDALDVGRNQYGKFSPEQATDYVSKLTSSERDALRIGYAQQFMDKIGNAKNSINAAEEILGAENNAGRLQALFDTPQEYEVFKGILKSESRNVKSAQQIGQGSATGRRAQLQKEFEGDNVAIQMLDLAGSSPFQVWRRIIAKAPELFKDEQVAASVSKILNTGKPDDLNKLLRSLESRAERFALEQSKREAIGMAFTKATGRMSGASPTGADAEREQIDIPSAVEGENTGVTIPADYVPEPEEREPEETVIIEEAPEPEEPVQAQRRGGRIARRMQEGGYVIEDPNELREILKRTSVSAMGEGMRTQGMKNQFAVGRVGYRQPVGDDSEVGVGISGLHAKYKGQTPQGQKFSGGQNMVSGVDVSYNDRKNNLYAKYGVPMGGKDLQFSGAGYSRNLDNNRGTVGIQHSTLSPEGMPDRQTQLFYRKDFRNGGAV
jgi:hypothetical protein